MKRWLFVMYLPLLFLAMAAQPAHAVADYLDVKALALTSQANTVGKRIQNLPGVGPVTVEISVVEGQPVRFQCHWRVDIVDHNSYWHTPKGENWPVRIDMDNRPLGHYTVHFGPGTKMGRRRWTSNLGMTSHSENHPKSIAGHSGPAIWTAKGVGRHSARCVVNQPKQISDRNPNNNITGMVVINVVKKKPVAPPAGLNKSCRPFLIAGLAISPLKHFSDPKFGPAEVPKREMLLFLRKSEAAGNFVNCHYESKNRDVTGFVINLRCNGAVPVAGQQHSYSCRN